jgi:hypothetical protein
MTAAMTGLELSKLTVAAAYEAAYSRAKLSIIHRGPRNSDDSEGRGV